MTDSPILTVVWIVDSAFLATPRQRYKLQGQCGVVPPVQTACDLLTLDLAILRTAYQSRVLHIRDRCRSPIPSVVLRRNTRRSMVIGRPSLRLLRQLERLSSPKTSPPMQRHLLRTVPPCPQALRHLLHQRRNTTDPCHLFPTLLVRKERRAR